MEINIRAINAESVTVNGLEIGGMVSGTVRVGGERLNLCEIKGSTCTGIAYPQEDPYQADIWNESVIRVMCDECAYQIAQDI